MNVVRRERKIQYVVKSFEKCRPPLASTLAKTIESGGVGKDTCVLCLCGESLMLLSETIAVKDSYIDVTLSMKTLIEVLNVTPAVSLELKKFQKICKTCVNRLSSFFIFTKKCSKTAEAFRNIEKLLTNEQNIKKLRTKRHKNLVLPFEDIYKYSSDTNFTNLITSSHNFGNVDIAESVKKYDLEKRKDAAQTHTETQKLTFNCDLCDVQNMQWYIYTKHQKWHHYGNVIEYIARNKLFCSCCLKVSDSLVAVSEELRFNNRSHYRRTINAMIQEIFNVSVIDAYHPALICEACIDQIVKTYSFMKKLEDSVTTLNQTIVDIGNSLNKAFDNLKSTKDSQLYVYLNYDNYFNGNTENLDRGKLGVITPCFEKYICSDNDMECSEANADCSVTGNNDKYRCKKCGKFLFTFKEWRKHTKTHKKSDQRTCKRCNEKFSSTKRLLSHCKKNHDANVACKLSSLKIENKSSRICEYCNEKFSSKSLIKAHIINKHAQNYISPPYTVQCELCSEKFISEEDLTLHRDSSHNKLNRCPHCYKVVKDQHLLEKHIRACENTYKPFKCDLCNVHFTSEDKMAFHRRKHFARNFHCEFCPGKYWTKSELNGHMKKCHRGATSSENSSGRVYQCTMCTLDFQSKKERIIHIASHPIDSEHVCRICSESFKSKINYYGHVKRHSNKKDCECSICGKFYTKYKICNHLKCHRDKEDNSTEIKTDKTESKTKTTMCDVCGRLLSNHASLVKHGEIHKEQEQCPHCFKFINSTTLYRHMKTHDDAIHPKFRKIQRSRKLFSCGKCDYSSMFADCLEAHENRFHLQVRPFKCDVCNKAFYAKITLKEHIKTHSGSKPEQCEQCGNRFVSKKALRLHVRLHTGERPYACDLCEEKFLSASRRQAHRTRKHFEPSVQCQICMKMYYTQSAVRIHIRDYHSGEPKQRGCKKKRV